MRLKSLYIQGFKSFAKPCRLEFDPGISVIVGPNGSGKSNIADAIRWVLGEQSGRALRADSLTDVIFSGSDERRPLGMAEVTLTIDNSDGAMPLDFKEIAITRRTFRSGESGFFINRAPCRLRDIQALFMDTGLSKGALALVGQGEVDAILRARPEERRLFLEETAGVTRYRHQRSEAVRRLEETDAKLVRVADIIKEVEAGMRPLREEAQRAERFEELFARARNLEVGLWHAHRQQRRQAWESLRQEALALRAEAAGLRQELESLERGARELEAALQQARSRVEEARRSEETAGGELHEAQRQRAVLEERLEGCRRDARRAQERLLAVESETDGLQEEAVRREAAVVEAARELEEAEAALESQERECGRLRELWTETERRRQAAEREAFAVQTRRSELAARLEAAESEIDALQPMISRLQNALAEAEAAAEASKSKEAAAREALQRAEEASGEALAEWEAARQRLQDARRAEEAARRELRLAESNEAAARSRAAGLQEWMEAYEGYASGVRAVLAAKRPGIAGVVAELLRVPQEWEAAIEVALGGSLQHLVAETTADAEAAVEFLKSTGAGRATLLPLDRLRWRPLSEKSRAALARIQGVAGVASEIVGVSDARMGPVLGYLLDRVVLTDHLRAALAVTRAVPEVARAASADGDLALPSGPITGGARMRRGADLLARRRRLQVAEAALREAGQSTRLARRRHGEALAALQAAENALETAEQRRDQAAAAAGEAARSLEMLQERRRQTLARVEELKAELAAWGSRLEAAQARASEVASELARPAFSEDGSSQPDISALDEEREAAQAALADAEEAAARIRERLAVARQRHGHALEELDRLRRAVERGRNEAGSLRAELLEARAAVARCEQEIAESMVDQERASARAAAERKARQEAEAEMQAAMDALELRRQNERELRARLEERMEALQAKELARERAEQRLDQAEYELSRLGADPSKPPPETVEPSRIRAAETALNKMRDELRAMGHVNRGALDALKAAEKRLEFLERERSDLEAAKEQIHRAIREIDETSAKRLEETLRQVRAGFDRFFKKLFGGGRADLVWCEPENVLDSGLEIVARPPGKRAQSLAALSGGERALATIALLFAIMNVRPSPFYVLDEIDAALDERNVERFAALLREYSENRQIVMITHRQATMEVADALYGVTLEGAGASRVVSVRPDWVVAAEERMLT